MNWKRVKQALFSKAQVITGVTLTFLISSALVRAYQEFSFTDFSSGTPISAADMNNKINLLNKRLAAVGTVTAVGLISTLNYSSSSSTIGMAFSTAFYDYTGGLGDSYVSNSTFVSFTSATQGFYEYTFLLGGTGTTYNNFFVKKNSEQIGYIYGTSNSSVGHAVGKHYFNPGDTFKIELVPFEPVGIDPLKTRVILKKL